MEFKTELLEYFKEKKMEVTLYPEQTKRKFQSLKSFYDFVVDERDFW